MIRKKQIHYGIYALILVLLAGMLSACQKAPQNPQQEVESRITESSVPDGTEEMSSESQPESQQEEPVRQVCLSVKAGRVLTDILEELVQLGWGESPQKLLEELAAMDRSGFRIWSQMPDSSERAFSAEGYIAPGEYIWTEDASTEEVLRLLLFSWDQKITVQMEEAARQQGYTMDEVLTMASIVEWESAQDPSGQVKPKVAAVVRNRIESGTPLQMDVTVFYLQEALAPYRDKAQYENGYDTYIRTGLPAGPIASPSLESVEAVLEPAKTQDLFFVYDEQGNYYFAEDYEQHLRNCETAGIE